MKQLKNIAIAFGYILGILFILTLLATAFHYFNLFPTKVMNVIKIFIPLIALLVGGFKLGKESNQKGWLEGLKLSLLFLVVLILFNYLGLRNHFEWKNLLYYALLMATCIFGSMLGISRSGGEKK